MSALTDVRAIAASRLNACALRRDGTLLCWGANDNIQAYDPGFVGVPTVVTELGGVTEVAVGASHRCVRLATGAVRCWGYGQAGRLGTGDERSQSSPTPVAGLPPGASVTAIGAGLSSGCAVVDGRARCWGASEIARTMRFALAPAAAIEGLSDVRAFAMDVIACALDGVGAVRCWGPNREGALGTGDTVTPMNPLPPVGLRAVATIATQGSTTCAIEGGAVLCWGANGEGTVGDGTTTPRYVPVRVVF